MTESRIYELLNEIGGKGGAFGADDRHKLMPETVGNVCRTLSNMLYDSLKDKSSAAISKRADLIQLICKWCVRDGSHFNPDDGNYSCFLRCLKGHREELDDFLDEQLAITFDDDHSTTYVQYYKEQDEKRLEKRRRLGAISDGDQRALGDIEFTMVKKEVRSESIEEFLGRLLGGINKGEVVEKARRVALLEGQRASRISLAYALLNLPKNNLTVSLLTSIIHAISIRFDKDRHEMDLLEYILVKAGDLQLDAKFRLNLLKKFPFIYERPLILLCRDELSGGEVAQPRREGAKCLSEVIKLSRENHRLKMRIILLVYELFALSDYNARVLNVLKRLE